MDTRDLTQGECMADSQSWASRMARLVMFSRASQISERFGASNNNVCRMDSSWREAGVLLTCTHKSTH